MTWDMSPDPGPEQGTVYIPGTPGAAWTDEEISTTRKRVQQMITPEWDAKDDMYNPDWSDTTKVDIIDQIYFINCLYFRE